MAAEWEAALGMELGMGTHYHHHQHHAPQPSHSQMNHHAAFSHSHSHSHSHSQPHHYHFYGAPSAPAGEDHMPVDEMLDLSSHLGAHDFFPGAGANGHYHGEAVVKSEAPPTPPATAPAASFNLSSYADEFYLPVPVSMHCPHHTHGQLVSCSIVRTLITTTPDYRTVVDEI
jgi:hypothetical protein